MDHCSGEKRENMDTFGDPSTLLFYLQFLIIYDQGVLVPFTSFETEFLTAVKVAPYSITQNIWEYSCPFIYYAVT